MAQRISPEKQALIRQLYAQCGTYAVVARLIGCSSSTVARIVQRPPAPSTKESGRQLPK